MPGTCFHPLYIRPLFDLPCADDTLILGTGVACVEELASAIEKAGAEFGMTVHWKQTQALSVCSASSMHNPHGDLVDGSGSVAYLGELLTADGRPVSEVSPWYGMGDCKAFQKMWGHGGISTKRKHHLFKAIVASKLQYCPRTVWLVSDCATAPHQWLLCKVSEKNLAYTRLVFIADLEQRRVQASRCGSNV